jgi:hypothetical protein
MTTTSESDVVRAISRSLSRHTDLRVVLVDDLARDCRGSLACVVEKVRTTSSAAPFLLEYESARRRGGGDEVVASLYDVEAAHALALAASPPKDADAELELDARLTEAARLGGVEAKLAGQADAETFAATLVESPLRPGLERLGHWEPFGAIDLFDLRTGDVLELDGRTLARTHPGPLRIIGVPPGPHRVRVERAEYAPFELELTVAPRAVSTAEVAFVRADATIRTVTSWSGAALVLLGASLSAYAAIDAAQHSPVSCIEASPSQSPADACSRAAFTHLGTSSLLSAPLGYSIAAAGALAWTGSAVYDGPVWVSWVTGAAVGALAYAFSAQINGPRR